MIFCIFIFIPILVKTNQVDIPNIQLRKCCEDTSIIDLKSGLCEPDSNRLEHIVKLDVLNLQDETKQEHSVIFDEASEKDQCDDSSSKITYKFNIYSVTQDFKYVIDTFNAEHISTLDEVCIDVAIDIETNEEVLVSQKCLSCPKNATCVNFCCAEGFTKIDNICQKPANNSAIPLKLFKAYEDYTYINYELFCERKILKYDLDLWKVTEDGVVVVDGKVYKHNNYCIDQIDEAVLVCHNEGISIRQTAKIVVMTASIICIVIVIIFNCVIDELRNNQITGIKIPMCLFLAVSFAITIFSSVFRDLIIDSSSCIILGLFHQFSVLSIFFWMTCLSVSVWLRFRKIQNIAMEISRNNYYYSISIICPTMITIITMVLQLYTVPEQAHYIHPNIGEKACQLGEGLPQFIYFHLTIIILLTFNFLLFLATVCVLYLGPWRLCGASRSPVSSVTCLQTYGIFVEFLFLMGVNWTSESASFFVKWLDPENWDHPILLWLEIVNWSIGIILFILFIRKQSNRSLVLDLIRSGDGDSVTLRTYSSQLSSDNSSNDSSKFNPLAIKRSPIMINNL